VKCARRIGNKQFTLEEGERLNIDSSGFSYQFEFTEEANLFEGAKVDIIIGGRSVSGHVTALLAGRIIVTVQDDFGPLIKTCVLRIDNTALLQALHDRLQKIEVSEVPAFCAEFSGNVLLNAGKLNPSLPITRWPVGKQPNDRQRNFVGLALANEISWLWGPPGTGKTDTLSALVRILYEEGKRILICSNTNQAVDQLLFQLCENMDNAGEPALADGRVLRLGFIAHAELKSAFEKFITLDAIVAKKSEALIVRKAEVEGQLQRLSRDVASAEQILSRFSAFESAQAAVIAADKEAALLANKAQSSSASLRICADQRATLEQELGQRFEAGAIRRMFLRDEAATHAWWGLVVVQFERRSANKKLQWSNSERSIATCQSAQASPT
jgi:AAA domain